MSDKIELLPCPFCGMAARLESNHDWHRIIVDHDEACIFLEPEVSMVPATDDQLSIVVADWNRRAALSQQPAPTAVPDGWKLVPVEPTKDMLDEFDSIVDYGAEDSKDAWFRMLAATPAAPAPAAQEPSWGSAKTIGNLIAQLSTLDPSMPIYAPLRLDDGRVSLNGLILSKEWKTGRFIQPGDDAKRVAVLWTKPDDRTTEQPVELPEGVTISKDVFGTVHIKLGEFDFIQIKYDHRYTYNSHQEWVANRIVEAITAPPAAGQPEYRAAQLEKVLRAFTADDGRGAFEAMCCEQYRDITRDDRPDPPLAWGYANSLTHDRWCGWASACRRLRNALLAIAPTAPEAQEPEAAPQGLALGCDYQGRHFGAPYSDAQCIDGYLWDEDSCDEPGGPLLHGGNIPCPKCNVAEYAKHLRECSDDDDGDAAAEHPECGCCGQTGACDPDCDCAEQPYSTTSDRYRAELYDEVWEQARMIGYGNVTEALAELERMKAAERERIERGQPDNVPVPSELRALLGKETV